MRASRSRQVLHTECTTAEGILDKAESAPPAQVAKENSARRYHAQPKNANPLTLAERRQGQIPDGVWGICAEIEVVSEIQPDWAHTLTCLN